jgi:hypothetical protein
MAKLQAANKQGFEIGFEADKKSNQKSEEEILAEREKIMWVGRSGAANKNADNQCYADGFSPLK